MPTAPSGKRSTLRTPPLGAVVQIPGGYYKIERIGYEDANDTGDLDLAADVTVRPVASTGTPIVDAGGANTQARALCVLPCVSARIEGLYLTGGRPVFNNLLMSGWRHRQRREPGGARQRDRRQRGRDRRRHLQQRTGSDLAPGDGQPDPGQPGESGSSIHDNEAWAHGAGMHLRGADLFAENTTFSANWARWGWGGGAIYALTDGEQDPAVFLHHVTMADNVAGTPLKDNEIRMGSGVLTVKGNIIEDNCPGTSATIVTLGSNTASACVSPGLNDQAVPSALLLPPTASLPHYPLDPASPALGFAKACPAVDQIRTVRPATCDSGSIEQ